ncbi:hypothetical protein, partial [Burkholderia sp. 3C]
SAPRSLPPAFARVADGSLDLRSGCRFSWARALPRAVDHGSINWRSIDINLENEDFESFSPDRVNVFPNAAVKKEISPQPLRCRAGASTT